LQFRQYGKKDAPVILLLHGGGLSWWNFREAAEQLQRDYRVILPILDGHGGTDRQFSSIEDNAREIIGFVEKELGGRILLMGGVSLGAQILLEILSRRSHICRYALVESALVIPSKLTHALVRPTLACSYGLIRQKWFAKAQAAYLKIPEARFEDYFRDTCAISGESMGAFLEANALYTLKDSLRNCGAEVRIFVGEKEIPSMKRSAHRIQRALPDSTLEILPGMRHGELALCHPEAYAALLRKILKK
jgi:pimeloyl-ACP methyl ester carboxylesterase